MTMPNLMNCEHQPDGRCDACKEKYPDTELESGFDLTDEDHHTMMNKSRIAQALPPEFIAALANLPSAQPLVPRSIKKVIFLDFDGVVRVIPEKQPGDTTFIIPPPEFCKERMERVVKCCTELDAKIVVTSDWRKADTLAYTDNREEIKAMLEPTIPWSMLHDDWMTPIASFRWREVEIWLSKHPEIEEYAILEDMRIHFRDASFPMQKRIVWCNNRFGFVPTLMHELMNKFSPPATTP